MPPKTEADITALIVAAFSKELLRDWEASAILVLLRHPGSTCAQLGALVGWKPRAWDMQIGKICNRRGLNTATLDSAALDGTDKPIRSIASFNTSDRTWSPKPAAIQAFELLGLR
ncbi:hypothetical protein [Ancylobacter sp. G4_0304]|uniref:hypothetical protein n=1 Tax=Ancylobacter sp. G4_0304 TaxID=3114289 RepID=UPI0039C6F353